MFEKISQFLVPIAGRLNNNRYLQVLRDAFMLAFPLTIFGSIFVVLTNLPFLNKIMNASMLTSFQSQFGIASTATMGIMSVFVVFGIGYYLSKAIRLKLYLAARSLWFPFALNAIYRSAGNGRCHYRGYPGRPTRCKRDVSWHDYGISFW